MPEIPPLPRAAELSAAVTAAFAPDGPLAETLPGFEARQGQLDPESGAIEFATDNGNGEALHDGTHAGDLLPQLAMLVISPGGKVVTVRSDDLDESDWSGPVVAELRFAMT